MPGARESARAYKEMKTRVNAIIGSSAAGLVRIGAHMSIAGGHDRAVRAASEIGFVTVQVFTKSTNQWRAKPLTDADVAAFRAALAETGICGPVGHNSYLINLASPDDLLWRKSVESMTLEVERAEALGLTDLVAHPAQHVGAGEKRGLARIAKALNLIHRNTRGFAVKIALETTAGQGSNLGCRFEHLAGNTRARFRIGAARRLRGHLPPVRGRVSSGVG